MRSYNPEQIMLSAAVRRSSRDMSVMKEKLIFSEVGNGVSGDELYADNGYDYYTNQGVVSHMRQMKNEKKEKLLPSLSTPLVLLLLLLLFIIVL
ncbi:hypothetical protein F2P81_017515 [Scophthalmus maximus]|uniref:Uncharacterized protein n=1 Tax=Scophthalmus maximus TaxID=52904 RepID=A0A6A4SII8_SCOMX|nr:hypothetical protein F2P81_017515 [Scophthalmus maximus]